MAEKDNLQATLQLIRQDFEIEEQDRLSETALLQILADQIDWLIGHRMEWLLSLMYRLDVEEAKVNAVLHPAAKEPANWGLARLVLDRQKKRAYTKKNYQTPSVEEDMEW